MGSGKLSSSPGAARASSAAGIAQRQTPHK